MLAINVLFPGADIPCHCAALLRCLPCVYCFATISAMEEVGLASVANRLSKELSGGMKRRLSVAMSICGNSEVSGRCSSRVFLPHPSMRCCCCDNSVPRLYSWMSPAPASTQRREGGSGGSSSAPSVAGPWYSPHTPWMRRSCFVPEFLFSL